MSRQRRVYVFTSSTSFANPALHEYPGGRRFMFADPWGNILGVYQSTE